jgi:Ni/Fe-hydrogenase subunit HybB-like protein
MTPSSKLDSIVLPSESGSDSLHDSSGSSRSTKPFSWPFTLALFLPVAMAGVLLWLWSKDDYTLLLRIAWVSLCSFVPGLSILILLGSLAQLRKRPILSMISVALGLSYLFGAWLLFKWVAENANKWL